MITFALSDDQQMLLETVRKFAAEELRANLRAYEKARGVPAALDRQFHELGLALVDVPEAQGGVGMGTTTAVLVHEELAYGDPGAAVALWSVGHLPAAALEMGTPEQAGKLLARFAGPGGAGKRGAVAWSEPGAQKTLPEAGFATTARKDGDDWVLDGKKAHVLHAGLAEVYVVFAQVDTAAGWKGIAAFAVEAGAAGLTVGPRVDWIGLETATIAPLTLAGVRVPESARLAGGADPALAARRFLARVSLAAAARQVGLARASYDAALAYTQDRQAFGKTVAHFQSVSFELAEMAMEVESARWMVWRAADELDRGGKRALTSVAQAAVHANELSWRVADDGVQLLGGAGFIQDYPAEKWMRDTKALALFGGSDELSRLAIAGAVLGQPEAFGSPLPVLGLQSIVS